MIIPPSVDLLRFADFRLQAKDLFFFPGIEKTSKSFLSAPFTAVESCGQWLSLPFFFFLFPAPLK